MTRVDVRKQIVGCRRCSLRDLASSPVPFRGPSRARLLVIGEAPGRWEDRARRPFVGPSGSLLGKVLADTGFDVGTEVAFMNTVCCWPNRPNATPTWEERDRCGVNLDAQLAYLEPERVLLVGAVATETWWPNLKISQVRGRWWTVNGGTPAIATYHPAAVLRDPGLEGIVREDVAKAWMGPTLTARDDRDYECVWCGAEAEVWVSEGRDVTKVAGGLGIGWCIRHLRLYRRRYRKDGGGAVQTAMDLEGV